jgi:predicted transglutaminase-like cysteine proteinase
MRISHRVLAGLAVMLVILGRDGAQAAAFGAGPAARLQDERIQLDTPTLAPMAYSRFCLQFRDECQVHRLRDGVGLMRDRWAELVKINADVNRAIAPQPNLGGVLAENWRVAPRAGECHDYAVTKRHELMARGWPSRALLLAEVVTSSDEHHLVLVVRTRDGDFVADNLVGRLRPWFATNYRWLRMQSPENPMFWFTVAAAGASGESARLADSPPVGPHSDLLVEADVTEIASVKVSAAADGAPAAIAVAQTGSSVLRGELGVEDRAARASLSGAANITGSSLDRVDGAATTRVTEAGEPTPELSVAMGEVAQFVYGRLKELILASAIEAPSRRNA